MSSYNSKGVFLESTTEFTVDAKSVTPTGEGKVKAFVTSPTGTRTEALVNNNNDGTYKCMYAPFEQGVCYTNYIFLDLYVFRRRLSLQAKVSSFIMSIVFF